MNSIDKGSVGVSVGLAAACASAWVWLGQPVPQTTEGGRLFLWLLLPGTMVLQAWLHWRTWRASQAQKQALSDALQRQRQESAQSEEAHQAQVLYANDILSKVHTGMVVMDQAGKIQDCNQTLSAMTGMDRTALLGQDCSTLFEVDEARLLSVFTGYGQMLSRLAHEQAQTYAQVLTDSQVGALLLDAHGCIQQANARFAALSGHDITTLSGRLIQDLVPQGAHEPNIWSDLQSADEHFYRPGASPAASLLRQDGRSIPVEISLINHLCAGQIVTLALFRSEQDLPWGVVNATALQKLIPSDEDTPVAKLRHQTGTHIPVRVSSSFILDGTGQPTKTVVNVIDISSLVDKSVELRAQHRLLKMTMDAMQDGVVRVDRQGRVVSANPMSLDLLGLDKNAMAHQALHELLPGKQHGHDLAYWLPLRTDLLLSSLVQNLQEHPELVQSLPIPLLHTDRMGRLQWATPTACALLGLNTAPQSSPEPHWLAEQTTRELLALRSSPSASKAEPEIVEVSWRAGNAPVMRLPTMLIDTGTSSPEELMVWLIPDLDALGAFMIKRAHNIEWTILQQPEGRLVPVVLTASPLEDLYNRLTGAVVTIKDMREIKGKEAENLRMVHKMQQSQRLDALGQLAAGVAHDFNNLLGVIQNHAELVEMKLGTETKVTKNLSAIQQATIRARDIVLKLNALGRERKRLDEDGSVHDEQEVQTLFELRPLIEETQGLLLASLKGIEIQADMSDLPEKLLIKGQSGSLQQVIVNLCVNGGHAIADRRDGLITVKVTCPGENRVQVIVSDNGSGIPPEIMPRIFEPFFTTKEVGKGTGLGLSMARSIITQMDGTLECQSEVGKGTAFTIELPCTCQDARVI